MNLLVETSIKKAQDKKRAFSEMWLQGQDGITDPILRERHQWLKQIQGQTDKAQKRVKKLRQFAEQKEHHDVILKNYHGQLTESETNLKQVETEYMTLLNMNKQQIDQLKKLRAKQYKDEWIITAENDVREAKLKWWEY